MKTSKIKYGAESRANFSIHSELCHDCDAKLGEEHQDGCDVEECSKCFHQKISCDCNN